MVALLTDDVFISMPPMPFEYQGRRRVGEFCARIFGAAAASAGADAGQRSAGVRRLPARPPTASPRRGLYVLTLDGDRVSAMTWFSDNGVFPQFGLPRALR